MELQWPADRKYSECSNILDKDKIQTPVNEARFTCRKLGKYAGKEAYDKEMNVGYFQEESVSKGVFRIQWKVYHTCNLRKKLTGFSC